jgi:purine-nucleoside phosphorylase
LDKKAPQDQLKEAAELLLERVARRPTVGIVLGSGLSSLGEEVDGAEVMPFETIPHLAKTTVAGHPGRILVGLLAGKPVAVLQGRLHHYEGYSPWQVTFPVRLLGTLGVRVLIVTNAAGALHPHFRPGDLMLINDHINLVALSGGNPLTGLEEGPLGPRFVGMGAAYSQELHKLAWAVGSRLGLPLRSGTYVMVAGPSYETPAELRLLRSLGADAVGMSTAGEVIVATQLAMRVLGISCITNIAAPGAHAVSHQEVLARGREIEPRLGALIKGVLGALPAEAGK